MMRMNSSKRGERELVRMVPCPAVGEGNVGKTRKERITANGSRRFMKSARIERIIIIP